MIPDPLYRHTTLGNTVTLPVFGHNVRFATNSPRVLASIEDCYGHWGRLLQTYRSPLSFTINVVLHDGDEGGRTPRFTYRMPVADRLLVNTRGSYAVVETDRRQAYAYVTSELVQNDEYFRSGMLETMTLMLITSFDRCPIHAAAVKSGDRLLLLAGVSGSGKSTLAYAILSDGHEVASDDTVYVQLRPEPRLWYSGGDVCLLPSAAEEFPGLRDVVPRPLPTGKNKVVIPLSEPRSPEPSLGAPLVCLLNRGDVASLTPVGPMKVHSMLSSHIEPGFELMSEQRAPVLEWLSARGGWELTLSSRAADAIPFIQQILAS